MDAEKVLPRLISGIVYIPYQKLECLYSVRPVTSQVRQQADHYYEALIYANKFNGNLPHSKKLFEECIARGVIDKDYKKRLSDLSEGIDELKISLFRAGIRSTVVSNLKKELDAKKTERNNLQSRVNKIYRYSLEGFCDHAKKMYLFMHSLYDSGGARLTDRSNIDIFLYNHLTHHYFSGLLDEHEIREFSKSGVWRNLWNAKKHDIFDSRLYDLNDEQKLLVHFSELYDFGYQYPEPPPSRVFEDDDVFDGWYLFTVRKISKDKKEKESEELFGKKDPKFSEIYAVAQDQEEANSIYSSNTDYSLNIMRGRAKVLSNVKGRINDRQFPDVQQELAMQSNQKFGKHVKGK